MPTRKRTRKQIYKSTINVGDTEMRKQEERIERIDRVASFSTDIVGISIMVFILVSIFSSIVAWWFWDTWQLGIAVGAFFAGSNTVSNMTFGGIQDSIAQSLGLSRTTILSLQSVGGAMGNMVCINNIVAVCSIVGILDKEGYILKRTVIPMIIYGLIAACVAYFL